MRITCGFESAQPAGQAPAGSRRTTDPCAKCGVEEIARWPAMSLGLARRTRGIHFGYAAHSVSWRRGLSSPVAESRFRTGAWVIPVCPGAVKVRGQVGVRQAGCIRKSLVPAELSSRCSWLEARSRPRAAARWQGCHLRLGVMHDLPSTYGATPHFERVRGQKGAQRLVVQRHISPGFRRCAMNEHLLAGCWSNPLVAIAMMGTAPAG